jgi:hypothetical protein
MLIIVRGRRRSSRMDGVLAMVMLVEKGAPGGDRLV